MTYRPAYGDKWIHVDCTEIKPYLDLQVIFWIWSEFRRSLNFITRCQCINLFLSRQLANCAFACMLYQKAFTQPTNRYMHMRYPSMLVLCILSGNPFLTLLHCRPHDVVIKRFHTVCAIKVSTGIISAVHSAVTRMKLLPCHLESWLCHGFWQITLYSTLSQGSVDHVWQVWLRCI